MAKYLLLFMLVCMIHTYFSCKSSKPSLALLKETYFQADYNSEVIKEIDRLEDFTPYILAHYAEVDANLLGKNFEGEETKQIFSTAAVEFSENEALDNSIRDFFDRNTHVESITMSPTRCAFTIEHLYMQDCICAIEAKIHMDYAYLMTSKSKYHIDTIINEKHLYRIQVKDEIDLSKFSDTINDLR